MSVMKNLVIISNLRSGSELEDMPVMIKIKFQHFISTPLCLASLHTGLKVISSRRKVLTSLSLIAIFKYLINSLSPSPDLNFTDMLYLCCANLETMLYSRVISVSVTRIRAVISTSISRVRLPNVLQLAYIKYQPPGTKLWLLQTIVYYIQPPQAFC